MTIVSPWRGIAAIVAGVVVVVAGTAAVVVVSFGDSDGDRAALSATIDYRTRFDKVAQSVPVLLRNRGDTAVTVTRLELVAPSVVTAPAESISKVVRPGWTRRTRLQLKPARCPDRGAPSGGPAAVVLTLDDPGSGSREVRLPAADPRNLLNRLAREDCELQRVLRVADIDFGTRWSRTTSDDGDPVLRGHLVISRNSAGGPVTVSGVRGSASVELLARSTPPWRLGADDQRVAVPLAFKAGRCDPHGLLDNETRFVFSAWFELAGEHQRHLTLRPSSRLKDRLLRLIADTCEHG